MGAGRTRPLDAAWVLDIRFTEVNSSMRQRNERRHSWRRALYSLGVGAALCATGCQVDVGGQTLPSPYYQTDDIQYFPPGPEFKLSREAAAQKAFSENQAAEAQ